MAFIEQDPEDEQDNPELARESGVISGSSLASRPSNRPTKSGYVNVQDYVEANKPGLEQFARDIGSGVSGAVTGSQKGTGQLLESFKGQQAPDLDYGQLGTYLTQEGLQEGEADLVSKALQSGKAPKQLSEMSEYQKALKEHQEAMELLKLSQGGTSQLGQLTQKVLKPQGQYGAGLRGLDASMLAAQKDFPGMVQSGGGVKGPGAEDKFVGSGQDYFERATKEAADIAEAGAKRRESGFGLIKGAAGQRLTGLEEQLKGQQTAAGTAKAAEQQKIIDDYLASIQPQLSAMMLKDAPDISKYVTKAELPAKHFGQFATADQVKEFDVLRSLIDPGYNLETGGYGDIGAPGIDKAAYEQSIIDSYLKTIGALPEQSEAGGFVPQTFKTRDFFDVLEDPERRVLAERRKQEGKAGITESTSDTLDAASQYLLPGKLIPQRIIGQEQKKGTRKAVKEAEKATRGKKYW